MVLLESGTPKEGLWGTSLWIWVCFTGRSVLQGRWKSTRVAVYPLYNFLYVNLDIRNAWKDRSRLESWYSKGNIKGTGGYCCK